ncbi:MULTISPECIES: hypothetical protein [Larsenimonas]|uniref:Uncharacterized protein n=1 Tax=Larsenimonas suaedae TaxID=1851019 RepID=A0ABU1GTM4_9GAMM|nr:MULTISPECIES: hypothetical protein [Larsenimonas]MCM2972456.1 hypothetical protein [Larsenimonas suaedae]MCM5704428.1 hypothetical protein [Larsenimonas salina]MDR5894748.1 hypothetical protein [Larsenimonas suaedae]
MSEQTALCELGEIDLLDDNISTSHEVQKRNVRQLYLLSVEVRALMDVVCNNGQSSLLADRLEHHAEKLESRFLERAEKRRSLSLTYQFFKKECDGFDQQVRSLVSELRALDDDRGEMADRVHDDHTAY